MNFLVLFLAISYSFAGFHLGLPSAVQKKAKQLDEKIKDSAQGTVSSSTTTSSTQTTDTRLLWRFSASAPIYYGPPALSQNQQTVYFGTSYWWLHAPSTANYLYAVDSASGTLQWAYSLGSLEVRSAPTVAADGSIYFTAELRDPTTSTLLLRDDLIKLNSNGSLAWQKVIHSTPNVEVSFSGPTISTSGTIIVASDGLRAYNPDGTLNWQRTPVELGGGFNDYRASPVISTNGVVYFGHNSAFCAVRVADGAVKWVKDLYSYGSATNLFTPPAISSDGYIYTGSYNGHVFKIRDDDSSASVVWVTTATANSLITGISIAQEGTIYASAKGGKVVAINSSGTILWTYQQPDTAIGWDIYTVPLIGSDGTIYVGAESAYVYALGSDGILQWKYQTSSGINWSSPAMKDDGTLYIGNLGSDLFAIKTESLGLQTNAAWPKFHRNNQNTGR